MQEYEDKLHLYSNNKERSLIYEKMLKIADKDILVLVNKCLEIDKGGKL